MGIRINSLTEYQQAYQKSVEQPEQFWAGVAENFTWHKKWDTVLEWSFNPYKTEWFKGAQLNITENCIDRHLPHKANDVAFIWEPNKDGDAAKTITYQQLHDEVCKVANTLKKLGAKKGDRICIYLPMIPEAVYAMLACARIGAVHSVVFAGFSASSLAGRIQDCDCNIVITSDGSFRGDKTINLKNVVDEALLTCPSVKNVLV
ncbi:MAG: AMP-binding protein, partial [Bacteroidia bacterium]|nr:AMP-binding protein [Bacteroidia bacterium]